jgi:DNA polymerase III delta prime subunit
MEEIILNTHQLEALSALKNFAESGEKNMFLLEGAAGTGKTTTLGKFLEWLYSDGGFNNVAMSSPTHKALKVLMEMCPQENKSKVCFTTLHSLLGLKHQITKDGKEVFVKDKKIMSKFPFFELVIVDESSMISDQLFLEMEEQNFRNIKILFVGDSNQINPVNHSMAIPMIEENRKKYNIGYCKLEKIIGQAEGNPIIKYSQMIINDSFSFSPGTKDMVEDSGVVMMSDTQTKVLQQLINYYFGSSLFDEDANYCKIIAWRNKTVDFYNKFVRSFKYGASATKIVVDEKLIVDKPISDGDRVLFNTNEDLVVNTFEVKDKTLFGGITWKYYDCNVTGFTTSENIHILHESEETKYKTVLAAMSKQAVAEQDPSKRMKLWREYYSFMENFAQVKYNYAITCHCAQGSTYENCFVINSDIDHNRNSDERKRIKYTAVTRPRKMLYIF